MSLTKQLTAKSLLAMLLNILAFTAWARAAGPTEKVIYSFHGSPGGDIPEAGLTIDAAGLLYGSTLVGGTDVSECEGGCGTVFQLTPDPDGSWAETVLHSFDIANGAYPDHGLILDTTGSLFGATEVGGGLGEVYEVTNGPDGWGFDVLHPFEGRDGSQPRSDLVFDDTGNLYGTTVSGGQGNNGTVFELTPTLGGAWTETVIYRFTSNHSGTAPQAGLIRDAAGNLYGTTSAGGNNACPAGCGTVFELIQNGDGTWRQQVLHQFNGLDGSVPIADLLADAAGNLYGSAAEGGGSGCFGGCGTLFKLTHTPNGAWKLTVIHTFAGKDGGGPETRLVSGKDGKLYGTTIVGGNLKLCPQQYGCGVVFELAPGAHGVWNYRVLHKFGTGQDGILPAGLVVDPKGTLYGTTRGGGAYGLGTVFQVAP